MSKKYVCSFGYYRDNCAQSHQIFLMIISIKHSSINNFTKGVDMEYGLDSVFI